MGTWSIWSWLHPLGSERPNARCLCAKWEAAPSLWDHRAETSPTGKKVRMKRPRASSRVFLPILVAFACLVMGSGTAWGAAGDLDPSFGGDGVAAIVLKTGIASAVAIQDDGAVVIAGTSGGWQNQRFTTARILSDGSPDTSFGGDGRVSTTFAHRSAASAVVIQSDGAIVVAGRQGHQIAVARYLTNGVLDPSFSGDGLFTFKFKNTSSAAIDVGLLPNGDVLVGAEVLRSRGVLLGLVALAPDGTLDGSFGTNGRRTLFIGKQAQSAHVGATAMSDGGIVGAASTDSGIDVVRWTLDGTLDPAFGSGGIARIPFLPGGCVPSGHRDRWIGRSRGRGDRLGPGVLPQGGALPTYVGRSLGHVLLG